MPKQSSKGSQWQASQKLKGKAFALAGKLQISRDRAKELVEMEGGKLVDDVSVKLDYLIAGGTRTGSPSAAEKKATQLNQNKGAAIQVLSEEEFLALFAPSRDEVVAMLKGGEEGMKWWIILANVPIPDLSGVDLQGWKLLGKMPRQRELNHLKLDGADLSNAELSNQWLGDLHGVTLDGAVLENCRIDSLTDCSAKRIRLRPRVATWIYKFTRSNLSGADIKDFAAYYFESTGCVFRNAEFSGSVLRKSTFKQTDLSNANFSGAQLCDCAFQDADLSGANLTNADLTNAKFLNCNLSHADLGGAVLVEVDLSGAIIDAANFAGANLIHANLTGLDPSRAKGLDPTQNTPKGKAGPNVLELEKIASQARLLNVQATVDLGNEGAVELQVNALPRVWSEELRTKKGKTIPSYGPTSRTSLSNCLLHLSNRWAQGALVLDSIKVKSTKAPVGGKQLKELAIAAWCEAFGIEVPSEDKLKEKRASQKASQGALRDEMLAELRGGAKGIEKWNARKPDERQRAGRFRRVDLSGAKLRGANLDGLDFQDANFASASLENATFFRGNLAQVNFECANLRGASLLGTKCRSASFRGTDLSASRLDEADLRQADFTGANLRKANLCNSRLNGAIFTGAELDGVEVYCTCFDEKTKFPKGFKLPDGNALVWTGAGHDPRTVPKRRKPVGPLDAESFMKELEKYTDAAKLSKALAMLKADRFKLYAQVADDFLTGVVKSQSDPELVYSCRLAADGSYGCCTQNLNICGGLRGSLCKHLLVLIVGLSKSNELDPTTVYGWIEASRLQKPALDKDAMSETFLRYKGAEAGEVDWRPTETIPEDYYAM